MAWNEVMNIKGPPGQQGDPGTPGAPGADGVRGATWFTGNGNPPASIPGSLPNDLYLDLDTGAVWKLV